MEIKEPVCYYLGKACFTLSMSKAEHQEYKAWIVVAAAVAGCAIGLFLSTRMFLPKPVALGLIAICTYASARFVSDIFTLFSIAAKWLLTTSGGERGRQLLQTAIRAAQV